MTDVFNQAQQRKTFWANVKHVLFGKVSNEGEEEE